MENISKSLIKEAVDKLIDGNSFSEILDTVYKKDHLSEAKPLHVAGGMVRGPDGEHHGSAYIIYKPGATPKHPADPYMGTNDREEAKKIARTVKGHVAQTSTGFTWHPEGSPEHQGGRWKSFASRTGGSGRAPIVGLTVDR
jgi:hypothetical protein